MNLVHGFSPVTPQPVWALRKYTDEQLAEVTERLMQQHKERKKEKDFLLCANCSFIITSLDYKIEIDGRYRYTFKNPAGIVYTIGCFSKAVGCFNFGDPTEQFSWFPGFAWRYANCLNCFMHLGWFYQSGERHFYGLILDHLTAGSSPTSSASN
ncbi:MAG: cereblon family protein [Candidatus Aminicenantes bacterium]|nr:cereblon family protein [Candidatus Aminicenantes bacterium]